MAPVNTERRDIYVKATQATSMESARTKILGFLGFIYSYFKVQGASLTLDFVGNPNLVATFISYLLARHVSIGHIQNFIALFKKVNDFLKSGADENARIRQHSAKMKAWLEIIDQQLVSSIPRRLKSEAPNAVDCWEWVESLCKDTEQQVVNDVATCGVLQQHTAPRVQQALLAALVTGCYLPPARTAVYRSTVHPKWTGLYYCMDKKDCLLGDDCLGNHLELVACPEDIELEERANMTEEEQDTWEHFQYFKTNIVSVVIHHKNDR